MQQLLKRGLTPAVLATADTMIGSAAVFAIQMILAVFGNKIEYGLFSLSMSYIIMGQAVFAAFFGGPLLTILNGLPDGRREMAIVSALRIQFLSAVITALIAAGSACAVFGKYYPFIILSSLAFIGLSYRDAQRVTWSVEQRFDRAAYNSVLFAGLSILIMIALWGAFRHVAPLQAMLALAAGSLLVNVRRITHIYRAGLGAYEPIWRKWAHYSKWALPGTIVIWLQNNFYLSLVAHFANMAAVAEVAAGRMVVMPILLCSTGILRLMQVRFGRQIGGGQVANAYKELKKWIFINAGWGLGIMAVFWVAGKMLPWATWVPKYPNLLSIAALWFAFAGIMTARSGMTVFLQAYGKYRELFISNVFTVPTSLIGLIVLIPRIGLKGAVLPLILAEMQLMVLLFWLVRRALRSSDVHPDAI